ncbi:unnamed protein product, partial [Mesorhabditis belari]|uniref:Uncharacterized protein n=1 Tax=Mesorhabditis belari TaxID=2138241 RepID=A0AAF3ERY7_9BILA
MELYGPTHVHFSRVAVFRHRTPSCLSFSRFTLSIQLVGHSGIGIHTNALHDAKKNTVAIFSMHIRLHVGH